MTYLLKIRSASGHWTAPPTKRLARLLKAMLRGYGFQCLSCEPLEPKEGKPVPITVIPQPKPHWHD
jgi:hypothetical protein